MSDNRSKDGSVASPLSIGRRELLRLTGGGLGATTLVSTGTAQTSLDIKIRQISRPEFPEVTIFASVRDSNGDPVTGLSSANFGISEDGAPQTVASITAPESASSSDVSVSLVIDRSGSMAGDKLRDARAAATDFVEQFREDDEGQVIAFDDTIEFKERWSKTEQELTTAIDRISSGDSTKLWGATEAGVEQASPRVGRSAVIVLTDGINNEGTTRPEDVIKTATQSNVPIYTIGLGSDVRERDLQQVADETGGTYHFAPSSSELATIYRQISQSIVDEYELTYNTTNNATNGQIRNVSVDVTANGASGADTGTYEAPCAPLPTAAFDVSPENPTVGQEVTFDASPSDPNGGSLVAYRWDFDNNGVTDATGKTTTHTYTSQGSYETRLTVEKMCGARDVTVTDPPIDVTDGNYELSIISVNDPIEAGQTLEVEASLTNVSNKTREDAIVLQGFDGKSQSVEPLQLASNESKTETLTWDTDLQDAGVADITVTVGSVSVSEEVEITDSDSKFDITVERVDLDRTPHVTSTATDGFDSVSYDTTATLYGAPVSTSILIQISADLDSEIVIHRCRCEVADNAGQKVTEWTSDLAGRIKQGTYTYRIPIADQLDPGQYSITAELQHDAAAIGWDWTTVGTGSTEFEVVDDVPTVSVPEGDFDNDGQVEQALGNPYHVALDERSPIVKFAKNTLDIITGLLYDDTFPQFGINKGAVNDLAANTAQARVRATDGSVTIYWQNQNQMASGGYRPFSVKYDRAVLTARVPNTVDVVDHGDADYHTVDSDSGEHVFMWITTKVDKGIQPKDRFGFDFDDPSGKETIVLEAQTEKEVTVEYSLSLELGPLVGDPSDQAAYMVPVDDEISDIKSRYDYQAWQQNPHDVYWMSVGLTKDSEQVTVPSTTTSGGTKEYSTYVNGQGVVEQGGMNAAVSDYLMGELNSQQFNTIISSYLSGNPIN